MKESIQYYITEAQYAFYEKKVQTRAVTEGEVFLILRATVPQDVNGEVHQEFYVQQKRCISSTSWGNVFNTI